MLRALTINSDDMLDEMELSSFGQVIIWEQAAQVCSLLAAQLAWPQSHMGI
jgi:hypothetical protein